MLENQPHRERCYWCERPLLAGKTIDGIYCTPVCKDRGVAREQQRLAYAASICTANTWNGS